MTAKPILMNTGIAICLAFFPIQVAWADSPARQLARDVYQTFREHSFQTSRGCVGKSDGTLPQRSFYDVKKLSDFPSLLDRLGSGARGY